MHGEVWNRSGRRAGYNKKLETICNASAEKVDAAIACVGDNGTLRDVLRAPGVDSDLKEALAELQIFTSDVVGTDGARAKLRHEQNGYTLMIGHAAGFMTPNWADMRSPLVVMLNGGGLKERFDVNLLDECPQIPSATEMLQLVAENPVA